jgi:hypothetical protein
VPDTPVDVAYPASEDLHLRIDRPGRLSLIASEAARETPGSLAPAMTRPASGHAEQIGHAAGAGRTDLSPGLVGSVEEVGESGQDHRYGFGPIDVLRALGFAKERGY